MNSPGLSVPIRSMQTFSNSSRYIPSLLPYAATLVLRTWSAATGLPWRDRRAYAARAGPKLSDHRQRSFAGHESLESAVSQLGDPLCRPGRLLYPSSRRVAGKDQGGRRPSAGRTTLPATGHATALAPANAGRTAGGESKTYHHRQAPTDSIPWPHSLSAGGGPDPNPASFLHQATTLGL